MTDPVEFLHPHPIAPNPARRAELLRRTATRLTRRPKRWPLTVAALAAGGLIGWVAKPDAAVRIERVEVPVEVRVEVPVSAPEPVAVVLTPPPTPERLELDAELSDDRAEVARLYRAAGDAFLEVRRDYAEAARCYRLSLQTAPPAARRVTVDDSWLLAQMKVSYTREMR